MTKLRVEVDDRNRQLQSMITTLVAENTELRQRIRRTEEKVTELEKLICKTLEES